MYIKFLKLLVEQHVMAKEEQQQRVEDIKMQKFQYIISNITADAYPAEPEGQQKEMREKNQLHYEQLIKDGLISYFPDNPFATIHGIQFDGELCEYYGQVDRKTSRIPNGLGLVVDSQRNLWEGGFENGRRTTHMRVEEDYFMFQVGVFITKNKTKYTVWVNSAKEFHKGEKLGEKDTRKEKFPREKEKEFTKLFNYKQYFQDEVAAAGKKGGGEEAADDEMAFEGSKKPEERKS